MSDRRPPTRKSGHPSEKYVEHARSIEGQEWRSPHPYVEGVRVTWRTVRLVCAHGHYAGDAAWHPWDPGAGWTAPFAATLWAPDGEVETARLKVIIAAVCVQVCAGAHVGSYCNRPLLSQPGEREAACDRLEAILAEFDR